MRIIFTLLACLFMLSSQGQRQRRATKPALPTHRWSITASPLMLIGPELILTSGAEYELNKKFKLVADVGYVMASAIGTENGDFSARNRGFLFRPGIKWFTLSQGSGFYMQLQGFYKQVDRPEEWWVTVIGPGGSFDRLESGTYRRKIFGGNYIFGRTVSVGREFPLWLDYYVGMGVRAKETGILGQPLDRGDSQPWGMLDVSRTGIYPNFAMGLRMIFGL